MADINRMQAFKRMGDKRAMAEMVAKWGKQANQRLYRLEKSGLASQSSAYQWAQFEQDREKPRYTTSANKLEKLSMADLWAQALQINKKLESSTSTIRGVRELGSKKLDEGAKALQSRGIDITAKQLDDFLKATKSDYLHNKNIDSDQLLDVYQQFVINGNVTLKEFSYNFNRFKDKSTFDYNKFYKNVRNISKRKLEKTKRNTNKGSRQRKK